MGPTPANPQTILNPPAPVQPPVSPPSPPIDVPKNKSKLKVIIFAMVGLVVLLALGFVVYQKMLVSSTSQTVLAPTPLPTAKVATVDNKIFYALLSRTGALQVFGSDLQGKQSKLFEEGSVSAVFRLSPGNSELPYVKSSQNSLIVRNLLNNSSKTYPMEASGDAVLDVSWSPNGNELLMVTGVSFASTKLKKLSLVGGQIEDIGNLDTQKGTSPSLGTFPGYARFLRTDDSSHAFFVSGETCAPGPCYKNIYSYDFSTGDFKNILDITKVSGLMFSDVDPSGEGAVFNNSNMDANIPDFLTSGKISLYNFQKQTAADLVSTKSGVLNGAQFIDKNTLLYNFLSSAGTNSSAEATPSSQWYKLDLQSKIATKVPYSGYDLVPYNQNLGLTVVNRYQDEELNILDFNSGKLTTLYNSPTADSTLYLLSD